jgi:pimeloyl-ACP methyl ester carboxylesterase
MAWDANGDIVVVLPGITGSVLQRDGVDVFGLSVRVGLSALFSAGGSIAELALVDDRPGSDDRVTASRLAPDAHLVPGLWKIDGYGKVARYLRDTLTLVPEVDYREFPYDWRLDNRIAARRLAEESARWLHERRRTFPEARLVLVAHSMGGLVARYFLEVLDGWRDTRRLITFGTPYRGSLNALDFLVNGFRKGFGLIDLTDLMRSFTSAYQLLPIYPCVSVDGGPMRRLSELSTPLDGLDPTRVQAADGFHREIENAVARHRDDEEYRTAGYTLHPVVGSEHLTSQSATVQNGVLTVRRDYAGEASEGMGVDMGGDGTVPRVSATPIEHSDSGNEWFSGTRHSSLQNADDVLRQIRRTLQTPALRLGRFRAMAPVSVSLDLDDVYPAEEPPVVRARPSVPATDLDLAVDDLTGATDQVRIQLPLAEGWNEVPLPINRPGCYRVSVSGDDVEPASDLFVVAPA